MSEEGEEGTWYILMKTIYFPFCFEETNDTAKSHVHCVTNLHIFTLISPLSIFHCTPLPLFFSKVLKSVDVACCVHSFKNLYFKRKAVVIKHRKRMDKSTNLYAYLYTAIFQIR